MAQSLNKTGMDFKGCLYAKTVDQAFRKYTASILSTKEVANMKLFFQKVFEENEKELYADFYYPILGQEQKQSFLCGLNEQEKEMLQRFENDDDYIYFQIDKAELEFLFDITAREWLFSTFYTANKRIMIWGNYHLEFPIFCETAEMLEFYLDLAKKCGLECH